MHHVGTFVLVYGDIFHGRNIESGVGFPQKRIEETDDLMHFLFAHDDVIRFEYIYTNGPSFILQCIFVTVALSSLVGRNITMKGGGEPQKIPLWIAWDKYDLCGPTVSILWLL